MSEVRRRKGGAKSATGANAPKETEPATELHEEIAPPSVNVMLLLCTLLVYGAIFYVTRTAFARVPTPLPKNAPARQFAEGRALRHTDYLASRIGERQVSTPGEEEAAQYILKHVRHMAEAARKYRPDLLVQVERQQVTGGVSMSIFKFDITNVYNNLTNIVVRVAPRGGAGAKAKAVLVNAHYDSTIGTAGASDAASCVGVAMEILRTLIANPDLKLSSPVVFLFNGGEETLSQAAHGFMRSSKHAKDLGAFINLESTGPWGPDLVFQHTGDWTLRAYARAAPHPRGTTVAQDFFDLGLIPADTDYRMFSYRHYGNIPGIDIAFIFDGTAYHTARDEVDRIRNGTLQAMGENVLAAVLEYSRVLATLPPKPVAGESSGSVYFDLLGKVMIVYPHWLAKVLHNAPLPALLLLAALSSGPRAQAGSGAALGATALGALLALASLVAAALLPAAVGGIRAFATRTPYIWYGKPEVAYIIYVPAALAGLLLPYALLPWKARATLAHHHFLGTALLFAAISSALTYIGMHSAFLYASWAAAALAAAALVNKDAEMAGQLGLERVSALLVLAAVPVAVCMPTALSLMAHIMEKIGLSGATPGLLGTWVADAALGVVAGTAVLLALGTLTPYVAAGLGRAARPLVLLLLAASVAGAVWASKTQTVYSYDHPKRILLQHIHRHSPEGAVSESLFSYVRMDNYPIMKVIHKSILHSPSARWYRRDWESFYPLNHIVDGFARQAPGPSPGLVPRPPALRLVSRETLPPPYASEGQNEGEGALERLTLELDTGVGAWAVLNLTGDIRAWSLSDSVTRGQRSHMVRYSANRASPTYTFWVEVPQDSPLGVELHVKYLAPTNELSNVRVQLSGVISVGAVTTYQSHWTFGGPAPASPAPEPEHGQEGADQAQPAVGEGVDGIAESTQEAEPLEEQEAGAAEPQQPAGQGEGGDGDGIAEAILQAAAAAEDEPVGEAAVAEAEPIGQAVEAEGEPVGDAVEAARAAAAATVVEPAGEAAGQVAAAAIEEGKEEEAAAAGGREGLTLEEVILAHGEEQEALAGEAAPTGEAPAVQE